MRRISTLLVALASLAMVTPAHADWDSFWYGVKRDKHRNNCWPAPFSAVDQQAAVAPFGPMIAKGWERQNLLGDHHFEADSKTLTQAGQLRLRWIVTQAPIEHRTVFIERGMTAELSATRVETVKESIISMTPGVVSADPSQVVLSEMTTQGWAASDVDSASRRFAESAPAPRLPAAQASSGGGEGE